jgi:hypothetical protein
MGTASVETCVVGIREPGGTIVKAFDVCIKGGTDIYVNYSDSSTPEAHVSYHASGELHFKIGGRYVTWDGGPKGEMEPIRLARTQPRNVKARGEFYPIGWEVSKLASVLPALDSTPDMLVDAQELTGDSVLAFQVSAVGNEAKGRKSIVGFPVVATHRFGTKPGAEIEAFVLSEEKASLPYDDDF